jgi:hypothetical protein
LGLGQSEFNDSFDSERSCYTDIDLSDSETVEGNTEVHTSVRTLIDLYIELTQDSDAMIRYSCHMMLSKMTEIAKNLAFPLFYEIFIDLMKEPNP